MSMQLRLVLIVVSLLTLILMLGRIRTAKMRIEDSIFWLGFCLLLLVFSLLPQLVYWMAGLAGTQAPVNFIFLFVIFVLLLRLFSLTLRLSELEIKFQELVQRIALHESLERERLEMGVDKGEGEK
ncbi:MAG: DUF2304 domain-containing protein [Lachnospiraceae bacterium]|nr:DUF2304 domain-containing protein [Lachnospiraceae bacterium]